MTCGPSTYLILRGGDGRFRWFRTDGDGRITRRSRESYATLEDCVEAATEDIDGDKSGEKISIYYLDKVAVWPISVG